MDNYYNDNFNNEINEEDGEVGSIAYTTDPDLMERYKKAVADNDIKSIRQLTAAIVLSPYTMPVPN